MATASRHLCRHLARLTLQSPARIRSQQLPRCKLHPSPFRPITTTPCYRAHSDQQKDDDFSSDVDFEPTELEIPGTPYTVDDLSPEDRAHYETLTKPEQTKYLRVQNHFKALLESEAMASITEEEAEEAAMKMSRERPELDEAVDFVEERDMDAMKDGYWQEDEDDEFGVTEDGDDDYTEDMITSVAESELEVHRELREYVRIAAWELPGLLEYAQPYKSPDPLKTPLRFRYTTYMGESHPAQKKVVVEFQIKKLAQAANLNPAQSTKLIKLVGTRYNPDKDLVKMSCEKFENAAQNKRYLGDLVQKLIAEAKDSTDMFEDIPLDFRHHKPKKVVEFPKHWKHPNLKERNAANQELAQLFLEPNMFPQLNPAETNYLTHAKWYWHKSSVEIPPLRLNRFVSGKDAVAVHVGKKNALSGAARQGALPGATRRSLR